MTTDQTAKRKPGRPTKEEVAARGPAVETQAVVNVEKREMVVTFMTCCGRWEKPTKVKDFEDRTLVTCTGCGKRVSLYPMRQVVHRLE